MIQELQQALWDYLVVAFPDRHDLQVSQLLNISDGWESELYTFDLAYSSRKGRQHEALVLRLYVGETAGQRAAHEFHSIRRLHQSRYPVPFVYLLEREASFLGRPFVIMEKIEGTVLWRLMSEGPAPELQRLTAQFCQLMVGLHQLDVRPFIRDGNGRDGEGPQAFLEQWLDRARSELERRPQFDALPILDWLAERQHLLSGREPSVVHMDFHPNNVLVRHDGSMVVIDWTGFDILDPRLDLAWSLILADAYGGRGLHDLLLHTYERLATGSVEHVEVFEVVACVRRLLDVTISLTEGAERRGMRPEAAIAMRAQMDAHRRVYELLAARTGLRLSRFETLLASWD